LPRGNARCRSVNDAEVELVQLQRHFDARCRALPRGNARQNDVLTNEIADFTYEYSFTHTREVFTYFLFSENLCTEQYGCSVVHLVE